MRSTSTPAKAVVNETIGLQQFSAVTRAGAQEAQAAAEAEIARRGLFAAVVSLYYGVAAADTKLAVMRARLRGSRSLLQPHPAA